MTVHTATWDPEEALFLRFLAPSAVDGHKSASPEKVPIPPAEAAAIPGRFREALNQYRNHRLSLDNGPRIEPHSHAQQDQILHGKGQGRGSRTKTATSSGLQSTGKDKTQSPQNRKLGAHLATVTPSKYHTQQFTSPQQAFGLLAGVLCFF